MAKIDHMPPAPEPPAAAEYKFFGDWTAVRSFTQGEQATMSADIGLIGLAVMGQSIVLNMANHGYTVAVYNRITSNMNLRN